ncbi:MAG: preprotein translocase subunit YajC [Deltaproteobacteria bacterium]|nr:MAG: preprotein translocase subunit YajC [Deltaproteobacteria bacterium]
MFAVFYFFLLRPQQKRERQHRDFLNNLKTNDMVVTAGGIHGRVVKVDESDIIVLEIADKVRVKFSKNQIVGHSKVGKKPEKGEKGEKSEDPEKPKKK